jgi:prepilin-type N-terminal cleavage/methylation domain-containing protein
MRISFLSLTKKRRGVSLIELLAVVAIMSILAVVAAPLAEVMYFSQKEIELKLHLRKIRESIDKYYSEHGRGVLWNIQYNRPWDDNNPVEKSYTTEQRYKYQKVIWKGLYPVSWMQLYEGYLRRSYAVNPITGIEEDWVIIVSYPPPDSSFYDRIKNGQLKYPEDFEYDPIQWHSDAFVDAPPDQLSGIWDVRYPYHDPALDGASFYDQW